MAKDTREALISEVELERAIEHAEVLVKIRQADLKNARANLAVLKDKLNYYLRSGEFAPLKRIIEEDRPVKRGAYIPNADD